MYNLSKKNTLKRPNRTTLFENGIFQYFATIHAVKLDDKSRQNKC